MPGCSEPNQSEFREGVGDEKGAPDPKYAHGSPETYRQYYEDAKKKAIPVKELKSLPTKTAPGAAEPPSATPKAQ
jgi:hypothetical protein